MATTQYSWRAGGPKPAVEAAVFGKFIEGVADGDPIDMVDKEKALELAAKRKDLRPLFNWDDKTAAHQHRLNQMGYYLRALHITRVVVENGPTISHRAMFSVRTSDRRGYMSEERIRGDYDLTRQLMETARRELDAFIMRYVTITSFGKFVPRLQDVVTEMRDECDRLTTDASARSKRKRKPEEAGEGERVSA